MIKALFWGLLILSAILLIKILNILIFDFNRLTEYGMGYLSGLMILFLTSSSLSVVLGLKKFKKNKKAEH
ncbi:hypothetical protein QWY93_07970 [Echinicola jeungdonensis]|uniref:Uncharacterized protein n=1 Tax=Echinicola jeungdonensis TaxID=709343 RepID=A0ABV5J6Q0_9BACT|nr:hypothetical protein [Echinicola jeungdonensis]MDN3669262.1 hypothetical protein [Echinicola jeungdonensis]